MLQLHQEPFGWHGITSRVLSTEQLGTKKLGSTPPLKLPDKHHRMQKAKGANERHRGELPSNTDCQDGFSPGSPQQRYIEITKHP
eukprot:3712171-Amphidinium_carterae.1